MGCNRRLAYADISEEAKVPILLPREHDMTRLIIQASHARVFHSRARATLAEVRPIYWAYKGRSKVKQVFRICTQFQLEKAKRYTETLTTSLPHFRVNSANPFSQTGLDDCLSRRLRE